MITLIVFAILWELFGGNSEVIKNFTEQQTAIALLIMVASDLNIICNALKKIGAGRWQVLIQKQQSF